MKISLNEIKQAFEFLIEGAKSREELSNWALMLEAANDSKKLEYDPPHDKMRIWRGIQYLTGVDLLDMGGSYLHSIDNFIQFRDQTIQ